MVTFAKIQNLVKDGQALPEANLALIARSVSGEVGVLTDPDVQRAQINPDILSALKRGYYKNIQGIMSPDDAKGIAILADKLKEKAIERVREKARLYTQAKSKWVPKNFKKILNQIYWKGY